LPIIDIYFLRFRRLRHWLRHFHWDE
jgi:hypothetical protein